MLLTFSFNQSLVCVQIDQVLLCVYFKMFSGSSTLLVSSALSNTLRVPACQSKADKANRWIILAIGSGVGVTSSHRESASSDLLPKNDYVLEEGSEDNAFVASSNVAASDDEDSTLSLSSSESDISMSINDCGTRD